MLKKDVEKSWVHTTLFKYGDKHFKLLRNIILIKNTFQKLPKL